MSTNRNSSGAPAVPETPEPEEDKRHTAIHEAGHAVAFEHNNEIYEYATIIRGEDGSWGMVLGERNLGPKNTPEHASWAFWAAMRRA